MVVNCDPAGLDLHIKCLHEGVGGVLSNYFGGTQYNIMYADIHYTYMYTTHTCTLHMHIHYTHMYTTYTCTLHMHIHYTHMYTTHTCTLHMHNIHYKHMYTTHICNHHKYHTTTYIYRSLPPDNI